METVLVTGGAGFIGSNIVFELLRRGYRVKVLDNLSTGFKKNILSVINDIEFIEGDIRSLDFVEHHMKGVDYILHHAALNSVPRSIDAPQNTHETNTSGTLNLLLAARDSNVKKFIFASSSSIYGNRDQYGKHHLVKKAEIMKPMPLAPYPVSKLTGELYTKVFAHIWGVPTITLRYFNVFGPRQNPNSQYSAVIPLFIKALLKGQQPVIYGDGKQSRDFTFVANNVEANILAMNSSVHEGETINIACSRSISLIEIIEIINEILGTSVKPKFLPPRKADVRNSLADVSKAKKLIGYEPIVYFKEGMQKTIDWFKHHIEEYE